MSAIRAALPLIIVSWVLTLPTFAAKKTPPVAVGTRTFTIVARDEVAYVGETGGLSLRDISDPTRPTDLSWFPLPTAVLDVHLHGSHALLAAGTRGLVIADISDPLQPLEVARLDTDGRAQGIARSGRHLFLADGSSGLVVIDLAKIDDPRIVARITTTGNVRAIAVHGEWLALAESHGGARVFNIRRPENPSEFRRLETDFSVRDLCWIGDTLFVAAGSAGTAVYEPQRSNRASAYIPPVRSAQHVACSTDQLAISNLGSALQLVSTESLAETARLRVHRSAPIGRSSFDGTRLWVAVDSAGMGLLDVTNPAEPQRLLPREREFKVKF